jgi:hypothetical protein
MMESVCALSGLFIGRTRLLARTGVLVAVPDEVPEEMPVELPLRLPITLPIPVEEMSSEYPMFIARRSAAPFPCVPYFLLHTAVACRVGPSITPVA